MDFLRIGLVSPISLLSWNLSVTKSVDDGHSVDVMFLDFAKAFDKVSSPQTAVCGDETLLMKLKSHGINGKVPGYRHG